MALNTVSLPIVDFRESNRDRPVFNGSIYVGAVDTDPEIPGNQKAVSILEENGSLTPVAQPLVTGPGGYIVNNGSAVRVVVDGNYSLKVLDKDGVQVYYTPDRYAADNNLITNYIPLDGTVEGEEASNAIVFKEGVSDKRYAVGLNLLFPDYIILGKTQGSGSGGAIITATDEITTSNWVFEQDGTQLMPDIDYAAAPDLNPLPKKRTCRTTVETLTSYGQVQADGTVLGGTADFNVAKQPGSGLYQITFDDDALTPADQTLHIEIGIVAIAITAVGAVSENVWNVQLSSADTPFDGLDLNFVFTRHARIS